MGGVGSGKRRKIEITDGVKKLIIVARSFGMQWKDIDRALGYINNTDYLEDFRRQNPDFDAECEMAFLNRKMKYAQKFEKAAIPEDGKPVNEKMAIRLAEQYGILDKEKSTPSTAIQINQQNEGSSGLQICFVDAPPQLLE